MSSFPLASLAGIMAPRLGSIDPSNHPEDEFDLYSIPAFDCGEPEVLKGSEIGSAKQIVQPGDVLLSRIVPHIRRAWVVGEYQGRQLIASGEWIVFRSGKVNSRYLRHVLVSDPFHVEFMRTVSGVGGSLLRARPAYVAQIQVPLPPLPEQGRIAAILDKADALRAQRRAAIAHLDALTQSIFLDMFGDPATNPKEWPTIALREVISIPLRNGLSPSKSGKVTAKVLTLSAITGRTFDESSWKTSTFQVTPPPDQSVSIDDFLICRGNGNLRLVGKGYFPRRTMEDVTFPDTMIAARISTDKVTRPFLEQMWNSNAVRRQLESLARTTNGTFKINQSTLEGVSFFSPPSALQHEFARRIGAVEKLRASQENAFAESDALFASLQHRAFRGEL